MKIRITKQEKANQIAFMVLLISFTINFLLVLITIRNDYRWASIIPTTFVLIIPLLLSYVGYSQGWEHKRIQILEDMEDAKEGDEE